MDSRAKRVFAEFDMYSQPNLLCFGGFGGRSDLVCIPAAGSRSNIQGGKIPETNGSKFSLTGIESYKRWLG